jgi:dipeptidyl aminopeptidase/acylaminoacyl peptidase
MPKKNTRTIEAEDLYRIELITEARLSPDGQTVVYAQQRVDRKTEKKYSNLWVAVTVTPTPGGSQFTYGDQTDTKPRWSPDGQKIAFLSNRKDQEKPAQLFLIPFQGGEARPLCMIEGTIGAFTWSPDGKQIICQVRKTDEEQLEREKDEQKKKLGPISRHYQRVFYKLDGFGYLPKGRWHLWSVDVNAGKAKQLTDHPVYDELSPEWSPDGNFIVYLSNRSEDPDMTRDAWDVLVIPAEGGESRTIPTPVGPKSSPVFSPDGNWIAYYGREGEGEWYKNHGLWVVPAEGLGQATNLTDEYDLHVSSGTISDHDQPEARSPIWSSDSKRIYFTVDRHGSTLIMSIGRDGRDLRAHAGEGAVVGSYNLDRHQERLMCLLSKMDDPAQVYVQDIGGDQAYLVTCANQELFSKLDLGEVEELWIKGPDGNDLQGWILKPSGFDPGKKYASILEIHGGPLTQYGNSFMHEFYFLASKGFVVHFSNPRGGRGYGEAHAGAIWGGWGGADYDDLMAWTDFVEQQPYIDRNRMGVTGGSYGGYMTVWIIGHTDRFRAALTQRCVSNLISLWGSSDLNWVFQETLNNRPPFEDLEKYWRHSPIAYIGNAKTPTMVIHSENDLRCPIEQGEQVFVALKRLGVETEMVRFPDEFHGLSRGGRTDRRITRLNHIAGWFEKHLRDQSR